MLKAEGLEYEAKGNGEPVLLIHGALIADAMFPLMREAALAEHYRLIGYRRRGHGGSDPYSGPLSFEQVAQDAQALLKHLGVERAHVAGHSGGGAIAVQLALEAPSLVHSLALLEPAIFPPEISSAFLGLVAPVLEAYRSGDRAKALDLWLNLAECGADWRTEVEKTVPGGAEQAEQDAGSFFDVEIPALEDWLFAAEQARRITQPVLYVKGGTSGSLVEAAKQYFQSLIPHAEQVEVPGVNHLMQMRNPKAVAASIAEFLSRHPL